MRLQVDMRNKIDKGFLLLFIGVGLWLLWAGPTRHSALPATPETIGAGWNFSPLLWLGLVLSAWIYTRGMVSFSRRRGGLDAAQWRRARCFGAGLVSVAVALISPLDALSGALFSAHMLQHIVLVGIAAPLLALGFPLGPLLLGLPAHWDQRVGRWWQGQRWLQTVWQALTHPLVAWTVQAVTLWLWHIPTLYQQALTHEWLHAVEHLSFVATALLFWWIVVDRSRRPQANPLLTIGLLFGTALHSGLLGVLITFARQPWYPLYTITGAAWGLTALSDQQLAGVLMWVPTGFVYLGGALTVLYRTLTRIDHADRLARLGGRGVSLLVLATMALGLSGCFVGPPAQTVSYKVPEGNPQAGWYAIQAHGCHSCHVIPGVPGANSMVGPPLTDWASRRYIAGSLINQPANMVRWLRDPQALEPDTAMPTIALSETEIRDIAAFLYTLGYDE